jgi:hypothetical protein
MHDSNTISSHEDLRIYEHDELLLDAAEPSSYTVGEHRRGHRRRDSHGMGSKLRRTSNNRTPAFLLRC